MHKEPKEKYKSAVHVLTIHAPKAISGTSVAFLWMKKEIICVWMNNECRYNEDYVKIWCPKADKLSEAEIFIARDGSNISKISWKDVSKIYKKAIKWIL